MVIVRPRPEVVRDIPDWLRLYERGRLKEGAVLSESFSFFLDPVNDEIKIVDFWKVEKPTVIFYIEESVCWSLVTRAETVYTAYTKNLPIRVVGTGIIRDLELVDEVLNRFYEIMSESGHDLSELFGGLP